MTCGLTTSGAAEIPRKQFFRMTSCCVDSSRRLLISPEEFLFFPLSSDCPSLTAEMTSHCIPLQAGAARFYMAGWGKTAYLCKCVCVWGFVSVVGDSFNAALILAVQTRLHMQPSRWLRQQAVTFTRCVKWQHCASVCMCMQMCVFIHLWYLWMFLLINVLLVKQEGKTRYVKLWVTVSCILQKSLYVALYLDVMFGVWQFCPHTRKNSTMV